MTFAAALSQHPIPSHAAGEVVGQVLEQRGPRPGLAVMFVSGSHGGAFEDMVATVGQLLEPETFLAAQTVSVLGGSVEVEGQAAVSLWVGDVGATQPVRLEVQRTDGGYGVAGLGPILEAGAGTLLLLADPYSFPADLVLDHLNEIAPGIEVVGGLANAGQGLGANHLALNREIVTNGAVGVLLDAGRVEAVVSQGCRPIGRPYIVTGAEGRLLFDLGGMPALDRLEETINGLSPDDRALAAHGLHLGVVVDETLAEFGTGDFLIRNVMGADADRRAVAVGPELTVGQTVQFHVRDADSADMDLRAHLAGQSGDGVLVFTCNGRGEHLFGEPHHDASVISELLGAPLAGMFCGGEIGPVGGANHLHGFTASLAVFHEMRG